MIYTHSSFISKVDKNVCLNILAKLSGGIWCHGFLFPLSFGFNTFWIVWLGSSSFFKQIVVQLCLHKSKLKVYRLCCTTKVPIVERSAVGGVCINFSYFEIRVATLSTMCPAACCRLYYYYAVWRTWNQQ